MTVHIPQLPPACKCGVDPVGEKRTRLVEGRSEIQHIGKCPTCGLVLYQTDWYLYGERAQATR